MGLKNLRDLPLVERVQPIVNVGNHAGLLPQYRAPVAAWGGNVPAVVGERSALELRAGGPGGAVIEDFLFLPVGATGLRAHQLAAFSLAALSAPLAIFSIVPTESEVRTGSMVVPATPGFVVLNTTLPTNGWYLPRGSVLRFFATVDNVGFDFALVVRDVPASESGVDG